MMGLLTLVKPVMYVCLNHCIDFSLITNIFLCPVKSICMLQSVERVES
jgi:hypothetical protein